MNRRELLLGLLALGAGCSLRHNRVTIGSKNFTEQLVLGELLVQYLARKTPAPIQSRFYLAGTYVCQQALLAGRIGLYVEYTGTALAAILKREPVRSHAECYELVKREYRQRFGLEVLPPLGFDNSFAIVIRGDDGRRLGLKTISAAARYAPQWRMGVGYEFLERRDGYNGLVETYGLHFAEAPRVMDLGLLYRALQSRQVDIIAGANTDGLIAALDMMVLDDDRHYFPPYDAVPVVRRDILDHYPSIAAALEGLAGRISAVEMRRLNYAVDGEHKDAGEVVRQFLSAKQIV
jgi:osmoprotectant transport system substrate-binding protein